MAGLRNRVIHEYFSIDLEIIWINIAQHLPALQPQIQSLSGQLHVAARQA